MNSHTYRGVTRMVPPRGERYQAQIKHRGRVITWPRRFERPEDAARLWDVLCIYLRGPDAVLNFDGQPPVGVDREEVKAFLVRRGFLPTAYLDAEPPQYREPTE